MEEDKKDKISNVEENKLKVLSEYLIAKNLDGITDFTNFEYCLKPLIKNKNIPLKNIYDFIVGNFKENNKKRKYFSYARFYNAYLEYKKNQKIKIENKEISYFFEQFINSEKSTIKIVDEKNNFIGEKKEQNDFPINVINSDEFSLTKISVLCHNTDDEEIVGILLEYMKENDEKYQINLINVEDIGKTFDIDLQKKIYNNKEIRDSITHIFGTFNETITSIGFKCSSGNLFYHGKQEGEPFLFGCYGQKLQLLDLSFNDKSKISGLNVYFTENVLLNKNIKFEKNDLKIYFDENLYLNKDYEKDYEKIRDIQIFKLGKDDLEKFKGESIFIKNDLIDINYNSVILDKKFNLIDNIKSSTVIGVNNQSYSTSNNPFFELDKNPKIIIHNPFFPDDFEKQKEEEKNNKIDAKKRMKNTCIFDLNESIHERLSKKIFIQKKLEILEIKKKLFTIKREIISNINELIFKILKKKEIDKEIQIALNCFLEKKIYKKIKNKENKENKEKEIIKFLLEKLGLKNNEIEENIINNIYNLLKKENNKDRKISNEKQIQNISEKYKIIIKKNKKSINNNDNIANIFELIKLIIDLNEIEVKDDQEKEEKMNQEINLDDDSEIKKIDEIINQKMDNANKIEDINNLNNNLTNDLKKKIEDYQEQLNNERIKAQNEQFYGFEIPEREEFNVKLNILLKSLFDNKLKEGQEIYKSDRKNFPKKLRKWEDINFNRVRALGEKLSKKIIWSRPNETKNYFIFKGDPKIEYIKQSKNINNCYFWAAIGALCNKNSDTIKNLFHIKERTKEQAYGIYFYINGKRTLIIIDDYLAYDSKNNLYFCSSYDETELWVSLIEKAFAKVKGGYLNTENNVSKEAFEYLTGIYTQQIRIKDKSKDSLWKILKESKDYPICAGTEDFFFKKNLKTEHAYTLIEVSEENDVKKVKLRDPYGKDQGKNLGERNDIFSISYDDFYEYFVLVEINYFKKGLKENFIKIKKEQSLRMQIFELKNEYEDNEVSINLYQKNKYNPVFSYIMLIKKNEKENNKNDKYKYKDSIKK